MRPSGADTCPHTRSSRCIVHLPFRAHLRCAYAQGLHFRMDDSANAHVAIDIDSLESGSFYKTINSTRKKRMSTYTTDDYLMYHAIVTCSIALDLLHCSHVLCDALLSILIES